MARRMDQSKWERPEYTKRQVDAVAAGRLGVDRLNSQLRAAGKGVQR